MVLSGEKEVRPKAMNISMIDISDIIHIVNYDLRSLMNLKLITVVMRKGRLRWFEYQRRDIGIVVRRG